MCRFRNIGYVLLDGAQNRSLPVLAEDAVVENSADGATDKWRDPEQPELSERPSTDEERGTGAASWVDRSVRDRNADEMNHHQREADGQRREAGRRLAMGRSHDDEKEHRRHRHFGGTAHSKRHACDDRAGDGIGRRPVSYRPAQVCIRITRIAVGPARRGRADEVPGIIIDQNGNTVTLGKSGIKVANGQESIVVSSTSVSVNAGALEVK